MGKVKTKSVPAPADPLAPLDAADLLLITRKATGASDF